MHLMGMKYHYDLNAETDIVLLIEKGKSYRVRCIVRSPSDELLNDKQDIYNKSTLIVTYLADELLSATDRFGNSEISLNKMKDYTYNYNSKQYKAIDGYFNGSYKTEYTVVLNVFGG